MVPGLGGCGQATTLLADACRLPVVPFGFIPLPQGLVDLAELMPGGRLQVGIVELLKQPARRLVARQRLLELAFRQRERAQPAQLYALASKVLQFLGNLQRRFVGFPRVAVLAAGTQRIPELRTQRAPQAFHAIAWREPADDVDRVPHVPDREIGLAGHVEASTQPSQNHSPAVARRIAEPGENALEHLGRLAHLTLVQQLLATFALRDVPRLRAVLARLGFGEHGHPRAAGPSMVFPTAARASPSEEPADAGPPRMIFSS